MSYIDSAIYVAVSAHKGQTDKQGLPYIYHPLRVMDKVKDYPDATEEGIAAAVMHDVIEDCDAYSVKKLLFIFPQSIVEIVDLVSRDKNTETYNEYIDKIANSGNLQAVIVKLCDLEDNSSPQRACTKELRAVAEKRYKPSTTRLMEVLDRLRGENTYAIY